MCRLSETTRSPARTREICEAGYTKEGSSCYKPTGSMPTTQYGCDAGWTQSNGQCSYKAPDKPATVKYVCAGGAVPGPDGQCAGSVQGRAYVYLGGKLIAEAVVGGTTQYVHTDALGSPVARTGPDGKVISRTRFEPYGYVAQGARPSPATSQVGFTGHVQDAETELVYMQQRYYDPIAGRMLSVDPIETHTDTGQMFGRYHYANNSPYWLRFDWTQGLDKLMDCASEQLGLDDLAAVGAVASGWPIPGTKRFVTPGSSVGTSAASMAADKVFGRARLPMRMPTIVGGPGTGRALAIAGTKSVARCAGRAVPVIGWGLLAYDAAMIAGCAVGN